jgi:hypothetical protein
MDKLVCKEICAGLFPNERLVTIETYDSYFSVFVGAHHVDKDKGLVNVTIWEQGDTYAIVYVTGYSNCNIPIKVQKSLLR